MANGTNPLMLLDELRELGNCTVVALTDQVPPLPDLNPTHRHIGWDVTLMGDVSRDAIDDVFIFVMDDMELTVTPIADAAEPAAVEEAARQRSWRRQWRRPLRRPPRPTMPPPRARR
ncbi:hypothetical protein MOP88_01910 [Sphingomonas sp. WKB10]|nr:hypothetical protein [Sphingomonas sp. WKB10]